MCPKLNKTKIHTSEKKFTTNKPSIRGQFLMNLKRGRILFFGKGSPTTPGQQIEVTKSFLHSSLVQIIIRTLNANEGEMKQQFPYHLLG